MSRVTWEVSDRLREWLNENQELAWPGKDTYKAFVALRAVVELHQLENENVLTGRSSDCSYCGYPWPCPTLRIIEKKVFGE